MKDIAFTELIAKVQEDNLSKFDLESYHTHLCTLRSQFQLSLAEYEKKEALFMGGKGELESVAQRKVTFRASEDGQKLIGLKRELAAIKSLVDSVKNRLYSNY